MDEKFFSDKYHIVSDSVYISAQKPQKSCQDYATHGEINESPFITIADGCGSSANSDLGARFLTLAAKTVFSNSKNINIDYHNFSEKILFLISKIFRDLELDKTCLDSTLLFSYIEKNSNYIQSFMYGDGYLISTDKTGKLKYVKSVEFPYNAPFYLSYKMDGDRLITYLESVCVKTIKDILNPNNSVAIDIMNRVTAFNSLEEIEMFLMASDGIDSFYNYKTGEKIPPMEIIYMLIDVKSKKGEFLKRRVKRFVEDLQKLDIYNSDDLSVSGFMIFEK